jgi:hypothetical protein
VVRFGSMAISSGQLCDESNAAAERYVSEWSVASLANRSEDRDPSQRAFYDSRRVAFEILEVRPAPTVSRPQHCECSSVATSLTR